MEYENATENMTETKKGNTNKDKTESIFAVKLTKDGVTYDYPCIEAFDEKGAKAKALKFFTRRLTLGLAVESVEKVG